MATSEYLGHLVASDSDRDSLDEATPHYRDDFYLMKQTSDGEKASHPLRLRWLLSVSWRASKSWGPEHRCQEARLAVQIVQSACVLSRHLLVAIPRRS